VRITPVRRSDKTEDVPDAEYPAPYYRPSTDELQAEQDSLLFLVNRSRHPWSALDGHELQL
ncbi:hypothetical protein FRC08_012862, partial [Ceratobasidium sp. 394]